MIPMVSLQYLTTSFYQNALSVFKWVIHSLFFRQLTANKCSLKLPMTDSNPCCRKQLCHGAL